MRTCWEASRQGWEIFIDDPADPALAEFGFPEAAAAWLRAPAERLAGWDVLEQVSPDFMERVHGYLSAGEAQAVCLAEAGESRAFRKYPEVVRSGFAHHALLGPDWTDQASWTRSKSIADWVFSITLPFESHCDEAPSWAAFPDASEPFRRACELLAGVGMGSMSMAAPPLILPCASWAEPRSDLAGPPAALVEEVEDAELRTLQMNYYGVVTHIVAPGRVVRTDQARAIRFLEVTPTQWLASELLGGTRAQPANAHGDT